MRLQDVSTEDAALMAKTAKESLEQAWKGWLPLHLRDPAAGAAKMSKADQDMAKLRAAGGMRPGTASIYMEIWNAERDKLYIEMAKDPEGQCRRLGIKLPGRLAARQRQRANLKSTVANTFVRATVWDSVNLMFRMFRNSKRRMG